ncbi:hypothetical protein J6590_096975 [Homalodisca vitripennis]|nr:hypothetical protein J6590_096975 [Homalodisca vitripennis]
MTRRLLLPNSPILNIVSLRMQAQRFRGSSSEVPQDLVQVPLPEVPFAHLRTVTSVLSDNLNFVPITPRLDLSKDTISNLFIVIYHLKKFETNPDSVLFVVLVVRRPRFELKIESTLWRVAGAGITSGGSHRLPIHYCAVVGATYATLRYCTAVTRQQRPEAWSIHSYTILVHVMDEL